MAPHTPLLRPDRYFADRRLTTARVLVVLGMVTATGPGIAFGVGWLLAAHIDGTVMVDNPARPPEAFCDTNENSSVFNTSGCDAPERIERNVDPIIWDVVGDLAGTLLLGVVIGVALLVAVLHVGSWLAGGGNGLSATLAVTVWGLVPIAVTAPVSLAVAWLLLEPVTVTAAGDPATAFADVEAQLRGIGWLGTAQTVVAGLWGGIIWRYGLKHRRDLDGDDATLIASVVTLFVLLITVAT